SRAFARIGRGAAASRDHLPQSPVGSALADESAARGARGSRFALATARQARQTLVARVVKRARALMEFGTGSHVGKSVIAAALGRIFSDRGYRVAPFKAQNMALNSAATPDGREIGRAQAMQAEACRVGPCAEMNPILIKPASETGAQV